MSGLRGAALGDQNGRMMAEYDCYDLSCNPHRKGTKAHAAFVAAFTRGRRQSTPRRRWLDYSAARHTAILALVTLAIMALVCPLLGIR